MEEELRFIEVMWIDGKAEKYYGCANFVGNDSGIAFIHEGAFVGIPYSQMKWFKSRPNPHQPIP